MLENDGGKLFVISGPSGVGKGTIVDQLIKTREDVVVSVSYTSRTPRVGEQDGINYHFVDQLQFKTMISNNEFLEYAEVHGNYYGTSIKKIQELLSKGKKIIFEIDIKGGMKLKSLYPNIIAVFILPPSQDEIVRRINKRGSESPETLKIRLETMNKEMAYAKQYDYQVINDDLEKTVQEINEILDQK